MLTVQTGQQVARHCRNVKHNQVYDNFQVKQNSHSLPFPLCHSRSFPIPTKGAIHSHFHGNPMGPVGPMKIRVIRTSVYCEEVYVIAFFQGSAVANYR